MRNTIILFHVILSVCFVNFAFADEVSSAESNQDKSDTEERMKTASGQNAKTTTNLPILMGGVNLPSNLFALVGEELNIYFDNLVDGHDTDYFIQVEYKVGMHLERCFRFVPKESGEYPITIHATDKNGVTFSKQSTIHVADKQDGAGVSRSIIVLGDSTTDIGDPILYLNSNFSSDPMSIKTLGTRGKEGNRHEGRSGWAFRHYFTRKEFTVGGEAMSNAFFNPSTKTFDASYYFKEHNIEKPDWFFINLGINDLLLITTDSDCLKKIDDMNANLDSMIESIKNASPQTKIGVVLTIPPHYSQDAFGKAYENREIHQTRARYKRNNILWVKNQIERYDKRERDGIYLIPVHTNLDTAHNMAMETIPYNKRNPKETHVAPTGRGAVHPAGSGFWQIADVYWFFLKNMEKNKKSALQ